MCMNFIREDILTFKRLSGLSAYRVGWILARNGVLVDRLENGGDIETQTAEKAAKNLALEARKRSLDLAEFKTDFTSLAESYQGKRAGK